MLLDILKSEPWWPGGPGSPGSLGALVALGVMGAKEVLGTLEALGILRGLGGPWEPRVDIVSTSFFEPQINVKVNFQIFSGQNKKVRFYNIVEIKRDPPL